jgi:hypothetical protein
VSHAANQGVSHADEEANEESEGREACCPEAQYKSGGEELLEERKRQQRKRALNSPRPRRQVRHGKRQPNEALPGERKRQQRKRALNSPRSRR